MPRQDDEDDAGFGEASRYTAHLDRGWSMLDRGDLQQARNAGHQALKLRPEVPDAAMLMAAISLAESDPEGGLEWYERAIEADAEYVDAQLAAAQILLYDLDDPQRALHRAEIARDLEEATLADHIDLGLLEVEALVTLGDFNGARERLGDLGELTVLEHLLSADTSQEDLRVALEQFVGEPFDVEEEWEPVVHRAVQLAVRVARLYMDLGAAEAAVPWLDRLLRTFGDDADIWYLANEAAYIAGETVKAAQAALQVLQLDQNDMAQVDAQGNSREPDWAPSGSELHAKVIDLLLKCPEPQLSELARDPAFVLLVNEAPAVELVLEGIDPRVRALALAARSVRDPEAAPALTGLAVYRRNLLRLARDRSQFERELELALFDELALFFGLDDVQRDRLGLPAGDANLVWVSRRETETDEGRRKPASKPRLTVVPDLPNDEPQDSVEGDDSDHDSEDDGSRLDVSITLEPGTKPASEPLVDLPKVAKKVAKKLAKTLAKQPAAKKSPRSSGPEKPAGASKRKPGKASKPAAKPKAKPKPDKGPRKRGDDDS